MVVGPVLLGRKIPIIWADEFGECTGNEIVSTVAQFCDSGTFSKNYIAHQLISATCSFLSLAVVLSFACC